MHLPSDRTAHTTTFVSPVEVITNVLSLDGLLNVGARCSSVVRAFDHGAMVVGSILHGGPIELFLVLASAPRLV